MAKKEVFWKYFLCVFLVSLKIAFATYILHYTIDFLEIYYAVPASLSFISVNPLFWHTVEKFFASIAICLLSYSFVKKIKSYGMKIFALALTVTVLLEIRYLISEYYEFGWHMLDIGQHIIMFYAAAYFIFKEMKVFEK